jgi:hypothetical protein
MKTFGMAGMALAAASMAAPAVARDPQIEAPITAFVDAFNKGDMTTAKAQMAAGGVVIIDEVPPFRWGGPKAFDTWVSDDGKDAAANGITEQAVHIGTPTRELVAGNHAYVIVPSVYTFKLKGVAMTETAQLTFALDRGAAGWKIVSWTWTGPEPTPVN